MKVDMMRLMQFLSLMAILLAHTGAATADNLLINGDAEAGSLNGWVAMPTGVVAAVSSVSQSTGLVTPAAGSYFFAFTGNPAKSATMYQVGEIEPGKTHLRLTGLVQTETYAGDTDVGEAVLAVYDSAGGILDSNTSRLLVTSNFDWQPVEILLEIPTGGTLWRVDLNGYLFSGSFVNVFWDELKLVACPVDGDLNGNCSVGVPDLLLLLAAWGNCADCAPGMCAADLDGNCAVGVPDLLALLANWG